MCTSSGDDEEDEDEDARLDRASASRRADGAAIIARAPSSRPMTTTPSSSTPTMRATRARPARETTREVQRVPSRAVRRRRHGRVRARPVAVSRTIGERARRMNVESTSHDSEYVFLKRSSTGGRRRRRERAAARGRLSRAPVTANVVMVLLVAHHETPNRRRRGATAAIHGATHRHRVSQQGDIRRVDVSIPREPGDGADGVTVFAIVALGSWASSRRTVRKGCVGTSPGVGGGLGERVFQLKLVLMMKALSMINIPMYGVLKSSTTPFVMLLIT